MNGGGKAEKENTPSEANLQEEEVPRGTSRGARGARAGGVGGCTAGRGVLRARGWVHARPGASYYCISFEDFPETFVSRMLSFVYPGC